MARKSRVIVTGWMRACGHTSAINSASSRQVAHQQSSHVPLPVSVARPAAAALITEYHRLHHITVSGRSISRPHLRLLLKLVRMGEGGATSRDGGHQTPAASDVHALPHLFSHAHHPIIALTCLHYRSMPSSLSPHLHH